jgi:hypothetical protein
MQAELEMNELVRPLLSCTRHTLLSFPLLFVILSNKNVVNDKSAIAERFTLFPNDLPVFCRSWRQ